MVGASNTSNDNYEYRGIEKNRENWQDFGGRASSTGSDTSTVNMKYHDDKQEMGATIPFTFSFFKFEILDKGGNRFKYIFCFIKSIHKCWDSDIVGPKGLKQRNYQTINEPMARTNAQGFILYGRG